MSSSRKRRRKESDGVNASSAGLPAASSGAGPASAAAASTASPAAIKTIKARVMAQACGRMPPSSPRGFEKEQAQLETLLAASIAQGESNSVLLIGPRGCGKTLVANRAIESVSQTDEAVARGYYIVRLNGLLHADDNVALKEISRQIQLSTDAEGGAPDQKERKRVSTADTVQELMAALKSGTRQQTRCLVIVLDEFDLFAHPGKQSLLYTLLDTAQAGVTPLAIVGLSCRFDAEDLLEKRVLSRFSRRKLYLYNTLTYADYTYTFQEMLSVPASGLAGITPAECTAWNEKAAAFVSAPVVEKELSRLYDTNRDVRALQRLAILPVAKISTSSPELSPKVLFESATAQNLDAKAALLIGVSILELCLVIAMCNISLMQDTPFNFEVVYENYRDFVLHDTTKAVEWYSKPVAFKAFEYLVALELVRRVDGSNRNTPRRFQQMRLMLEVAQVREVLQKYPRLPTHVKGWLKA